MMRRVLLLYTGGTIGMDETAAGLSPVAGLLPKLLADLQTDGVELLIQEYPQLIDSSAITLAHWQQIAQDIARQRDDFDGFIGLHGTDTLAYTASMLAFALQGLNRPVVLTGAQLPLVNPRSDGWSNLSDALAAVCQPMLKEVVIVFDHAMLRGCCARKTDAAGFHGFSSPNAPLLAEFGIEPAWHYQHWRRSAAVFVMPSINTSVRVGLFWLAPGVSAEAIGRSLAEQPWDGAVIMSYGNGNAPAEPRLLAGIAAMVKQGGCVLNITQVLHGQVIPGAYAASQALLQAGAIPGGDMTPEAALAKLVWLCSQDLSPAERRALLLSDCIGECPTSCA